MNFSFHPEASREFNQSIDYYEECEQGLGYDFSIEVRSAIVNIVNHPNAWPLVDQDVRSCLTNRFPYSIIYSIEKNEIFAVNRTIGNQDPDSLYTTNNFQTITANKKSPSRQQA